MAKGKGKNVVETVTNLVTPIITEMGCKLWDVRFEKEGPDWYLRILVDSLDGVLDMDKCEAVTRAVNPIIDEADPIDQGYFMELGSPGLGRKLTRDWHYTESIDKEVMVHYIRAKDGLRDLVGILKAKTETGVVLLMNGEEKELADADIAFVKLNDDANLF
ncbi:MAG: ribosome maturation factor RimP [Oscillospiraceae bacterium]